jgi:hypothetical protein
MLARRVRPAPRSSVPSSPTHALGSQHAHVAGADEEVEVLPPHFRPFALRTPSHSSAHSPRTADVELSSLFDDAGPPARGRSSAARRFSLASARRSQSRSVDMDRDRSTGRRDLDELLCSSSSEDEDDVAAAAGYHALSASTLRLAETRAHSMSPRTAFAPLGSSVAAPLPEEELLDGLATPTPLAGRAPPPPALLFARRPSASLGSPPLRHSPTTLSRRSSASGAARIPPLSLGTSRRHSRESSMELSGAHSRAASGSNSQTSSLLRLKLGSPGSPPSNRLSVPTSPSQLASSAPVDTRKRSNTGPPTLSLLRPLTPLTSPTLVSAASFAPSPQPHSAPLAVSALSRPRSRIASVGGTQSAPCTHNSSPQASPSPAPASPARLPSSFSSFAGSSQTLRRASLLAQQRPFGPQEGASSNTAPAPSSPSVPSSPPPSQSMSSTSSPPIAIPPPSRPTEFLEGPWRASSTEATAEEADEAEDDSMRLSPHASTVIEAPTTAPGTFSDPAPASFFWSPSPSMSSVSEARQALPRMLSLPSLRLRMARSTSSTSSALQPRSTQAHSLSYSSFSAASSAQSTPTLGKRRLGSHPERSPSSDDRRTADQPETPERGKRRAARARRARAPPLPRRRSVDGAALR